MEEGYYRKVYNHPSDVGKVVKVYKSLLRSGGERMGRLIQRELALGQILSSRGVRVAQIDRSSLALASFGVIVQEKISGVSMRSLGPVQTRLIAHQFQDFFAKLDALDDLVVQGGEASFMNPHLGIFTLFHTPHAVTDVREWRSVDAHSGNVFIRRSATGEAEPILVDW